MRRTKQQLFDDIAKPNALLEWHRYISRQLDAVTPDIPAGEVGTFYISLAEAKSYDDNPANPVPHLDAMSAASGLTVAVLANAIINQLGVVNVASGTIIGARIAGDLLIAATTNIGELEAVMAGLIP